ncbi:hypothetical protein AVEN_199930-1 [Araneus ventricosus]|uniref:Uncharacterized protein n=1 Tax=Araneus ventricosus TaxID=182803 RepID=A0A4Y1ZSJ8_ARAVE|nr:hypothetical protein AVEN_199930-1 [Araneus ventricosus]
MIHFTAQSLLTNNRASNLHICTQHTDVQLSLLCYSDNIKQAGGCSYSAPCCAILFCDVYTSVSTSDHGNSFCLVVKILDSGLKGPRFKNYYNSYSNTALPIQKVYDTFHSTKSVTHFTEQCLHVPAHKQSGQQSAHIHAAHGYNYRFLDIQMLSNKLGVAPVVNRAAPSYSLMYKSQCLPRNHGNSFCLVVKMLDSGPKDPRFKNYALPQVLANIM